MMYREMIAVCTQIHTKHINTLCGLNVELLNVKLAVHIVTLEFFIIIKSFRSRYGPGVDSASNRNEYQEHFLGVKAAGA